MQNKKWMIGLFVCLCACVVHAGVIAAWNITYNATAESAGWTDFEFRKALPTSVHFSGDEFVGTGSITLAQTSEPDVIRNQESFEVKRNPALLEADAGVFATGQAIKNPTFKLTPSPD